MNHLLIWYSFLSHLSSQKPRATYIIISSHPYYVLATIVCERLNSAIVTGQGLPASFMAGWEFRPRAPRVSSSVLYPQYHTGYGEIARLPIVCNYKGPWDSTEWEGSLWLEIVLKVVWNTWWWW